MATLDEIRAAALAGIMRKDAEAAYAYLVNSNFSYAAMCAALDRLIQARIAQAFAEREADKADE